MSITRRLFDVVIAVPALCVVAPLIAAAAVGIRLSSRGPVFYRSTRAGVGGRPFAMYKLRTMHTAAQVGLPITLPNDDRVFWFGSFLRKSKIDELPQLWNVVHGDMALVGPRPEDPTIVEQYYGADELLTLEARPGLTSPGTIRYYVREEDLIDPDDPLGSYASIMRRKLALDSEYARRASVQSDIGVLLATGGLILGRMLRLERIVGSLLPAGIVQTPVPPRSSPESPE